MNTEYLIIINSVNILSHVCKLPPKKIIELLTGWCWDEEEASAIKIEMDTKDN